MLNQPQVADKRIWIESQQGPLPAAACRRWRCHCRICGHWHQWDRIRKIDEEGEIPLSHSLSPSDCLALPLPPLIPHESPRGTAILRAQALCVKES